MLWIIQSIGTLSIRGRFPKVLQLEKDSLLMRFSDDEIHKAVLGMHH